MSKFWKLGIIGWPLGYSLSPKMHTAALKAAGLEGEYKEYPVKPEDLDHWLETEALKLDGFNVTMPHKKDVFDWLQGDGLIWPKKSSWVAYPKYIQAIGAVNTVILGGDRPIGCNTDGYGFLETLVGPPHSLDLTGWNVIVLGGGGAGWAVAATLLWETLVSRLTVWCRTPRSFKAVVLKAGMLGIGFGSFEEELGRIKLQTGGRVDPAAARVSEKLKEQRFRGSRRLKADIRDVVKVEKDLELLPFQECDLLVNATPVGMEDPFESLVDSAKLHRGQVVYDLVYQPRETTLIRMAREKGCTVITGDEMLAAQGAAAFEIWTGVPAAKVLPAMKKALDEHFAAHS